MLPLRGNNAVYGGVCIIRVRWLCGYTVANVYCAYMVFWFVAACLYDGYARSGHLLGFGGRWLPPMLPNNPLAAGAALRRQEIECVLVQRHMNLEARGNARVDGINPSHVAEAFCMDILRRWQRLQCEPSQAPNCYGLPVLIRSCCCSACVIETCQSSESGFSGLASTLRHCSNLPFRGKTCVCYYTQAGLPIE